MAYIVKSASPGAVASPVSPLVRAPFDRQRDVLKLARMGNADCKRLWNSFADEAPGLARLVIADVEDERQGDAAATEKVDKRLRQAERLVVKARKPKVAKGRKKAPAAGAGLDALGQARALLADPVLAIEDPHRREWAYQEALRRRG